MQKRFPIVQNLGQYIVKAISLVLAPRVAFINGPESSEATKSGLGSSLGSTVVFVCITQLDGQTLPKSLEISL